MAEVWLGADEQLNRPVAVKLLRANLASDATFVDRLRREAIAVARIKHPGIVDVYDTVSDGGHEAVVMEYVPGRTLRELLDERHQLSVEQVIDVGQAVADILDAAHRAGIVHRDVKPGNILITPDGRVRLTDFGIATAVLAADELGDEGLLLGTVKYVAPEQVQGHLVDGRTDLYSLGIVLYESLTGHVPFDGPDERATAVARLHQAPLPVRSIRPDVPKALDDLVASLLRVRPKDRPSSAGALRDALSRLRMTIGNAKSDPTVGLDRTITLPRDATTRVATASDPTPPNGVAHLLAATDTDDPEEEEGAILATNQRAFSIAIGVLLLIALVVATVLLVRDRTDSLRSSPPASPSRSGATTARPASTVGATGKTSIVSVAEFDPPPGNGHENPGELGRLTDGRTQTAWATVCYRNRALAPKKGVGLVFQLSAPAAGHHLVVTSPTKDWSASVYVRSRVESRLARWGQPVDRGHGLAPGTNRFTLLGSGRFVLLWFTDLGDASCQALPFQLRVSEVSVEG